MTATDAAYIAGYFDGEGCISVWKRKPMYGQMSPRHVLSVQISSTDKRTLDWVREQLGGKMLYEHSRISGDGSLRADAWKWIVLCKRAGEVLELIVPYLKTKKAEAELAIALQHHMQEHLHAKRMHGKRGISPLSAEQIAFRDNIKNQLTLLKRSYKTYNGETHVS